MLLLVSILNIANSETDSRQRVSAGEWRANGVLFFERQSFLCVLVVIDRGHAALELRDAAIVAEIHMMRANRSQMGVGEAHVPTPHTVRHLMTVVTVALATRDLLLAGGGGRGRRRSRVELGDRVTVVQLRVAGNVVVARVALASGILYGQHIEIRAAVVLGMATATTGAAISLGRGWSGVLKAVRFF